MRRITFSRTFPKYHPKAGQPTYFIEKLNMGLDWKQYGIAFGDETEKHFKDLGVEYSHEIAKTCTPKYHTIRAKRKDGKDLKVGDKFLPVVWALPGGRFTKGNKQIVIAPPIEVKKVFDFRVYDWGDSFPYIELAQPNSAFATLSNAVVDTIAINDGFNNRQDLLNWIQYPKVFDGQIICWNESINY